MQVKLKTWREVHVRVNIGAEGGQGVGKRTHDVKEEETLRVVLAWDVRGEPWESRGEGESTKRVFKNSTVIYNSLLAN